jgi:carbamoyl-phosphate synthase large subunit
MRKILITSVGSGVGRDILNALTSARSEWYVIGVNSTAFAGGIYDCDSAWLAPPAAEAEAYSQRLLEIVAAEKPDLIVAGRDDDSPILIELREAFAALGAFAVVGSAEAVDICNDKYRSAQVLIAAGLPFARTIAYPEEVDAFLEVTDFPYIAKPRRGFGSYGVSVLFSRAEIEDAVQDSGETVLQEFLVSRRAARDRRTLTREDVYEGGTLGRADELSVQIFLDRDGHTLGVCPILASKRNGAALEARVLDDPSTIEASRRIGERLGSAGLIGSCNLNGIEAGDQGCTFFEVNARLTGATAFRTALGFNELDAIWRHFIDGEAHPNCLQFENGFAIFRSWASSLVREENIEALDEHGHWRKESRK